MLGFTASYPLEALGFTKEAAWLTDFSLSRNVILMTLFSAMTVGNRNGGRARGYRALVATLDAHTDRDSYPSCRLCIFA